MQTVNMHQAKTQLSKLVEGAVKGEPFILARAGKPLVKVEALEATVAKPKSRVGMLDGLYTVPDDFKTRWAAEIEEMFYGPEQVDGELPNDPSEMMATSWACDGSAAGHSSSLVVRLCFRAAASCSRRAYSRPEQLPCI